ncbi:MAG: hypothetical protein ABIA76_02975 [Candidatus Diapherotrites archaeon]
MNIGGIELKKLIVLILMFLLASGVYALDVPSQSDFDELTSKVDLITDDVSGLKTQYADYSSDMDELKDDLTGLKNEYSVYWDQMQELETQNDSLLNSLDSIQSKLDELEKALNEGISSRDSDLSALQTTVTELRTELNAAKAIAKENQTYINALEEEKQKSPLAGLFSLGEVAVFPVIIGLLVLVSIALIVFGYMKRDAIKEKLNFGSNESKEEGLTFLGEKDEKKSLKQFTEDELEAPKKGKWSL